MAVEREEHYFNEEADFDARWHKGLLAAGFSEEEIAAGVDWSDPRLKQVDLGSDVSGVEFEKARTRIALQLASDKLVDKTVQTPWERRRLEQEAAVRKRQQLTFDLLELIPEDRRDMVSSELAELDDETLTFLHDSEVKGRYDA